MNTPKEMLHKKSADFLNQYSQQDRENFNQTYRKWSARQVATIYIELPYLLDIYLGGLLWLTKDDPEAFKYITEKIPHYNNRVLIGHAPYFPDLNITEEQLLEYIQSPENQSVKMLTAPPTNMWKELKPLHFEHVTTNKKKECADITLVEKLTYVINTWPLVLDEGGIRQLKVRFLMGLGDKNINFGVVSTPGWDMSSKHYTQFDHWFVYHFHHWTDNTECEAFKSLFGMKLENSKIYSPPCVSNPETVELLPAFTMSDYTDLEKKSLIMMNTLTTFQYYRANVLLK